ncbi:hypothetical protein ACX0G9_04825 [Flavitalea flava]
MRYLFFILFSILLTSCNSNHKFDKKGWAEQSDLLRFPNRKYMIEDLLNNYQLKGKSYSQIAELLGQPVVTPLKFNNTSEILYGVEIEFGKDRTLNHTKTLSLKFNQDTIVQDFKIIEWRK